MPRSPRLTRIALCAALLAVVGTAPDATAQEEPAQDKPPAEERVILDQRPGDGELCIVCKNPIHGKEAIEIRYQGRRFYVQADMLDDFDADPLRYFADLQAHSGLFDELAVDVRQISLGWLVFGVYVVVGLVFAALCGYLAVGRGHPPLPWFFAGLAGNVAALFVLLVTPRGDLTALPAGVPAGFAKVPVTRQPVACPHCGAANHPAAPACSDCAHILAPAVEAETAHV